MVKVELVYIAANQSLVHLSLSLETGATVADALNQSEILKTNPSLSELAVGIFSKPVSLDTILRAGDRIELYRPLILDPKEKRRQRAKSKTKVQN
ncbi:MULTISPECIES: RnfH family protein [Legionella]|uniref:UPF0125 protein Ldro_0628 n=1 Tax=Legionella drozanskii LLAP-1 TaxID=1212489 RepID=A0A0W0T8A5_9GAMM|nr:MULTISPECIES: RnfH family protein [Legionella]KTC91794.1 Persistence and stress-resistance antitoxin PasI [Legionella drozanskii LLAP-1]PJE17991.1 MAG: RnfH family protein [Legionella sp.]